MKKTQSTNWLVVSALATILGFPLAVNAQDDPSGQQPDQRDQRPVPQAQQQDQQAQQQDQQAQQAQQEKSQEAARQSRQESDLQRERAAARENKERQQERQRKASASDQQSKQGEQAKQKSRRSDRDARARQAGVDAQQRLGIQVVNDLGQGLVVSRVSEGSPAHVAGLRAGDRITRINNNSVDSLQALRQRVADAIEQKSMEIEADRNRIERTFMIGFRSSEDRAEGQRTARSGAQMNDMKESLESLRNKVSKLQDQIDGLDSDLERLSRNIEDAEGPQERVSRRVDRQQQRSDSGRTDGASQNRNQGQDASRQQGQDDSDQQDSETENSSLDL